MTVFKKSNVILFFPFITVFLLIAAAVLSGCGSVRTPVSRQSFALDTVIGITLQPDGRLTEKQAEALIEESFGLCSDYEKLLSRTLEGSDIRKINDSTGEWVEISDETAGLINTALYYEKLTGGAVNPGIGAISSLWDFKSGTPDSLPDEKLIESLLPHTDTSCLEFMEENGSNYCRKNDSLFMLDLGFIAKGFIADRVKEYLVSSGVTSAIINLGGNVLTIGSKPDGAPFRIGIRKPFGEEGEVDGVVESTDSSVVTSGSYERYFIYNDRLYHHILDTKTGYPAESDITGITVTSKDSTQGDALSTACFILGKEKARELVDSIPGVDIIFSE